MQEHTATTQQAHDETGRTLNHNLDILDLQILAILRDDPLWKQRVADCISGWNRTTVFRRIDRLHDNDLLQSRIITGGPDDPRELYIAFETTDNGRTALQTYLICTDPDCDDLKPATAHVHEHVSADQYF